MRVDKWAGNGGREGVGKGKESGGKGAKEGMGIGYNVVWLSNVNILSSVS